MEKALEMGRISATGGLQLFTGRAVYTAILAVGTLILGLLISEGDYGLYAIALIPATTLLLFQDWGVGAAMTRYCAHHRSAGNEGELRRIIVSGLAFEATTGLALTLLSLSIADLVASTIFGKPESAFLIALASVSIMATSFSSAAQSIFNGFERMGLTSLTLIFQAVTQCALAPLLVYFGYGALGAIIGYAAASIVAGIGAGAMLYFRILRKLRPNRQSKSARPETLKPMLNYGIPLALATILSGTLTQFCSFMVASYTDVVMIGNLRISTNFAVLLTFFTIPIATVLFPAFSKLDAEKEKQLLRTVFTSSVKYTALFLMPATLIMMIMSKPMISTLYGEKWLLAPPFLALGIVANLFVAIGSLSYISLLQALGETKMLLKLNIIPLIIGIPLAFLLIPTFGVPGSILVSIIAGTPSTLAGLYWTWKRYGVKADLQGSARISMASALAAAGAYLFLNVFAGAEWIRLLSGTAIFLVLYLVIAPLVGAINQADTHNLRTMFSGFGLLSQLLGIPLLFVEQILRARDKRLETGNQ
jgi:O-antigen/teichoic acid export membrane protein